MSQLSRKLRDLEDYKLAFWCPACELPHVLYYGMGEGSRWSWNGDTLRPTFQPSVLFRRTVKPHGSDALPIDYVCHSFVTEGYIEFLNDSTHGLHGKTMTLPDWPDQTFPKPAANRSNNQKGAPMSYSISVRAATKAEAKQRISDELDKIEAAQPSHAADRAHALTAASAFVDLLTDDEEKDVVVSMSGSLSGNWTGAQIDKITSANLSITAYAGVKVATP